jgi:hypothetical protein
VVPLAGVVATAALAAGLADPAAAAETGYLAFAAGIVLLATGAVAAGATVPLLATATVVALAWIVPAGPARGFLVEAAAALALVLAALDRSAGARGLAELLRPVPALGLAFGLQALLRADELLAPPSATWALVVYAALPALGALATLALARLDGPVPAALAAAAALVLGPGFRPATVTALVALAAAAVLLAERGVLNRLLSGAPAGRWLGPLARLGAALLLAAPAAWSPSTAFVSILAGAAFALRRRAWTAPLCCAAAIAGAWAATLAWGGRPLGEAARLATLVPLAVPTLVWPVLVWPASSRSGGGRAGMAVTAVVLAVAAAIMVPVDGALAAPGALAAAAVAAGALGTEESERRRDALRAATALQGTWSAVLLTGAALAGAYPWLRPEPLVAALAVFGVPVGWPGALLVVALALALVPALLGAATAAAALRRRAVPRPVLPVSRWSVGGAGLLAALALLLQAPGTGVELVRDSAPVVLGGPDRAWSAPLDGTVSATASVAGVFSAPAPGSIAPSGTPVRVIVLDSALGNAAELLPGTPVATLALRWVDRPERIWTLRAGEETGEWAADRNRRRGEPGPVTPAPWRSWIPDEGRFFGHRFRTVLRVADPVRGARGEGGRGRQAEGTERADRLELRLRPDLPPGVVLTVFRLELRP